MEQMTGVAKSTRMMPQKLQTPTEHKEMIVLYTFKTVELLRSAHGTIPVVITASPLTGPPLQQMHNY
jgi:hypothetical protein